VPASPGTNDGDKRPMPQQRNDRPEEESWKRGRAQCSELIFVTVYTPA